MSDEEPKFGKLNDKMRMRDIWEHEAYNFTPWLAKNIHALGEALGLSLRAKQTEAAIGGYSLDLLAEEEETGRVVAIENQFNQTDHKHLGQLLTYAAGYDADIVIWIMEDARDEHRAAMEWLNRNTDTKTHFYLVQVKVLQIDDSLPVYQFIPVVASNKWEKEQHEIAAALSPEDIISGKYFNLFAAVLEEKEFSYDIRKNMTHTGSKRRGYFTGARYWSYIHEVRYGYASVYLELSYETKGTSDIVYKELVKRKAKINKKIKLDWSEERPDWMHHNWWYQCRLGITRECEFSDDEETLAKIRAWAVENMLKLAEAIPPAMLEEIADSLEKESNGGD